MIVKDYLKIPKESHVVGEKAANQVTGVFIENNCAVNTIKADYGEDLLVQPSFDEGIEHFKIWVQVKGTADIEKYRQKNGEIVRHLEFAHIFKWLRSKELCVLVLWDVTKSEGLFFLPKDEVGEWEFYTKRKPNFRVVFNEENILNKKTLPQLIWRARYEHYTMLASHAAMRESFAASGESQRHAQSMRLSVIIDFLKQASIIIRSPIEEDELIEEDDVLEAGYELKICEEFRQRFFQACIAMKKEHPEDSSQTTAESALALLLVVTLQERTGVFGLPPELVGLCMPVIAKTMLLIKS